MRTLVLFMILGALAFALNPVSKYVHAITTQPSPLQNKASKGLADVRLIALKDKRPLFAPMQWTLFRISQQKREQIGLYSSHLERIRVSPGHYEVVAKYQGIVRQRQFRVQPGTHSEVYLTLD